MLAYYAPFRDIPGSWWTPLAMLQLDTLSRLGRQGEADAVATELGRLAVVPPDVQRALKIRQARPWSATASTRRHWPSSNPSPRRKHPPQALPEAWLTAGEANLALGRNKLALLSYLHVPVYVPERALFMAPALLGSAVAYGRLEDKTHARESLQQLITVYPTRTRPSRRRTRCRNSTAPGQSGAKQLKSPGPAGILLPARHPLPMKRTLALLGSAAFALLLLSPVAAPAQSAAPAGSPAAAPTVQKKNLLTSIIEGGWVMFPIAACSILTVYLVGEGVTRTNPKKLAPPEQGDTVKNLFRHGDYVGAYNYCKANPSPMTNVVRVGVSYLGDGKR